MNMAHQTLVTVAVVGLPTLLVCLAVGLVVSIFETATQIHEQTLNFLPKLLAVMVLLLLAGGWMVTKMTSFVQVVFKAMAGMN